MGSMATCLDNKCVRVSIRIVRWLPVAFVVGLAAWAYYAFVFQLCLEYVNNTAQRVIYLVVFHLLLFFVFWSYFQAVFTPTGRPPLKYYLPEAVKDELRSMDTDSDYRIILERFVREKKLTILNRAYDQGIRFCIKCGCVKPDRAHHCSVCGHCVLKFDHHCPWVNNCINYCNYKHFILFLGYGFLLCVFGFFAILPFFVDFWSGSGSFRNDGLGKFQVLFLFFVAAMFGISMGGLFFYHLFLTARNQSTVESFRAPIFVYGVDKLGFSLGARRNFEQVFGTTPIMWFLPIFTSPANGFEFPQKVNNGRSVGMMEVGVGNHAGAGYVSNSSQIV